MVASLQLDVAPRLSAIGPAAASVREFLARHAVDSSASYATDLVFEELLSNVLRHGRAKASAVFVLLSVHAAEVELRVHDRGMEFDPTIASDEPQAEWGTGGRGLRLVHAFAQRLDYERVGGENRLRVCIARTG
ncbi:MAG: ATP-binding protein [Planctomycetes bacterium]|nr:ATP-binding protein [Planctomycetota bacterium]